MSPMCSTGKASVRWCSTVSRRAMWIAVAGPLTCTGVVAVPTMPTPRSIYLIEKKFAKPDEVYIMGYSNGATTALVSMTNQENDHRHHFAAAFAIAPGCSPSLQHSAVYTAPIIIFMGDLDDANNPKWCQEMARKRQCR